MRHTLSSALPIHLFNYASIIANRTYEHYIHIPPKCQAFRGFFYVVEKIFVHCSRFLYDIFVQYDGNFSQVSAWSDVWGGTPVTFALASSLPAACILFYHMRARAGRCGDAGRFCGAVMPPTCNRDNNSTFCGSPRMSTHAGRRGRRPLQGDAGRRGRRPVLMSKQYKMVMILLRKSYEMLRIVMI